MCIFFLEKFHLFSFFLVFFSFIFLYFRFFISTMCVQEALPVTSPASPGRWHAPGTSSGPHGCPDVSILGPTPQHVTIEWCPPPVNFWAKQLPSPSATGWRLGICPPVIPLLIGYAESDFDTSGYPWGPEDVPGACQRPADAGEVTGRASWTHIVGTKKMKKTKNAKTENTRTYENKLSFERKYTHQIKMKLFRSNFILLFPGHSSDFK